MDTLDHPQAQLPWLEIFIFLSSVVFVFAVFKYVVLDDDEEGPVNFKVLVPEQCSPEWKSEVLQEPTIKVLSHSTQPEEAKQELQLSGSSAIRCYCPANGRLLGLVNPSTPDGIDRAIAKAKEAQTEWAQTTFKQRRRVLKTMLKCVMPRSTRIWFLQRLS